VRANWNYKHSLYQNGRSQAWFVSEAKIHHLLLETDKSLSDLDSDDNELSFSCSDVDETVIDDSDDSHGTVQYDSSCPFAWSRDKIWTWQRLAFTGNHGRRVHGMSDPVEYFNLFLTNDTLDMIVIKTNIS